MSASGDTAEAPRPGGRWPDEVERFDAALAEWLGSFTVPAALGAEMASACAAGAAWLAVIGAGAVRRAGWPDTEALTWGMAVGGLAGALEAARRSLAAEPHGSAAHALLASDGLVAAAHEAASTMTPERLGTAFLSLAGEFGDGGPWRRLSTSWPRPAWPVLVPCALGPAAREAPEGPWASYAEAWRTFDRKTQPAEAPAAGPAANAPAANAPASLWRQPGADASMRALLRAAAQEAGSSAAAAADA